MGRTYPPEPAPSKLRNVDVKLDHGCCKNLSKEVNKNEEDKKYESGVRLRPMKLILFSVVEVEHCRPSRAILG